MINQIIYKINDIKNQGKLPIVCLMGPTASGKTALAFNLADKLPTRLISVDSALVYQDMNIGTAKPSANILKQYPHDLIDIISPLEQYSVANFVEDSSIFIDLAHQNDQTPVLVGGTMLYFKGFWEGLDQLPESDPEIRKYLEHLSESKGLDFLYLQLKNIDPITAERLQPTDFQRILRALEIFEITKQPMSSLLSKNSHKNSDNLFYNAFRNINLEKYQLVNIAIIPNDRKKLHQRIEMRFDQMLNENFLDELKTLRLKYPNLTQDHSSMRCVGYRQAWDYLEQVDNYDIMREKGIASTRQLAKRQLTWLRNMPQAQFIDFILDIN